ncbi:hypothetical protein PspLS_10522 [Pyricularia sp. CBS 133598]|nr:hypothetical protein PspLS_10522 [Pyricularia sp. CBS 133598]
MKFTLSSAAAAVAALAALTGASPTASPLEKRAGMYDGYKVYQLDVGSDAAKYDAVTAAINQMPSAVSLACDDRHDHIDVAVSPDSVATLEALGVEMKLINEDLGRDIRAEGETKPYVRTIKKRDEAAPLPDMSYFDSYHVLEEHFAFLEDLQAAFPENSETFVAGKSLEGRDIMGIHLWGKAGKGKNEAVVWHGTVHAREWITAPTVEYMAYKLVSGYLKSKCSVNILDQYDFYIMPVVNPDGFVYTHTTNRLWRKNRQVRTGASCVGTDVNRNWPNQWDVPGGSSTNSCSETYRGEAPGDTPENKVLVGQLIAVNAAQGVKFYIDWHSYSQLILLPYGYSCTAVADGLERQMELAGGVAAAIKATNGLDFVYGPTCTTIYQTAGGSNDWVADVLGSELPWAFEMRPQGAAQGGFVITPDNIVPSGEEIWAGMKDLFKNCNIRDGLWTSISVTVQDNDGFSSDQASILTKPDPAIDTKILKSLDFDEMKARSNQIAEPFPNTLQWLLTDPNPTDDEFTELRAQPTGFREWLQSPTNESPFWITGSGFQKTQRGLLLIMLYEILSRQKDLRRGVWSPERYIYYQMAGSGFPAPPEWTLSELKNAISRLLSKISERCQLALFIDGLDKLYVHTRMASSRAIEELRSLHRSSIQNLELQILVKANGVFLWVVLVVENLLTTAENNNDIALIWKLFDALPLGLEELYNAMTRRLDSTQLEGASKMYQLLFRWREVSDEPLHASDFWRAINCQSPARFPPQSVNDDLVKLDSGSRVTGFEPGRWDPLSQMLESTVWRRDKKSRVLSMCKRAIRIEMDTLFLYTNDDDNQCILLHHTNAIIRTVELLLGAQSIPVRALKRMVDEKVRMRTWPQEYWKAISDGIRGKGYSELTNITPKDPAST